MKDLFAANLGAVNGDEETKTKKTNFGRLLGNTVIQFNKAELSSLNLIGNARGYDIDIRESISPALGRLSIIYSYILLIE